MTMAGKRILIVEDEPIVAMCLEDALEALGCVPVGPVSRLEDGLMLARSETLDAAILDINLGGERSYPIAEALREREIPFVFASGYGAPDPAQGMGEPLMEKPYSERDVRAALERLLHRP